MPLHRARPDPGCHNRSSHTRSASTLTFPDITEDLAFHWWWPDPPFAWRHLAPSGDGDQPCRIEASRGGSVDGHMLGFDPKSRSLTFRSAPAKPAGRLSFDRFRRLTLTAPLKPAPARAGAPAEGVPVAVQERDYRFESSDGQPPLTGRTAGHVQTDEGVFLYTPGEYEGALLRVFVPRTAYSQCRFGRSAQEIAAESRIATPHELLLAIEHQKSMPVRRIGQSLLDLGLLTPGQLERELARGATEQPLGERLVASGTITRTDLQTALAHKMGYPLVDLARFPVDPAVETLLPNRVAVKYKALALMTDNGRLIVAVDRPQRIVGLQTLTKLLDFRLVPVLASRTEIVQALARRSQRDPWSQNVGAHPAFFATTM